MATEKEQHQQIKEMKEIIVLQIIQERFKNNGNRKKNAF